MIDTLLQISIYRNIKTEKFENPDLPYKANFARGKQ